MEEPMIETRLTGESSAILKVWGNLDWSGAVILRHLVSDLVRPNLQLVIDLDHLEDLDGVGVSALLGTVRRLRAIGGTTRFQNFPARLRPYLQASGASEILGRTGTTIAEGIA
jgi:anti-anti-sigma factor